MEKVFCVSISIILMGGNKGDDYRLHDVCADGVCLYCVKRPSVCTTLASDICSSWNRSTAP